LSSSYFAPITIVSPSIVTLEPNQSIPSPSLAFSFAISVQPEVISPKMSRVNTYTDPLLDPLSSS
jgi:hypothetical protein